MRDRTEPTTEMTLADARLQQLERQLADATAKVHFLYKHHLDEVRKVKGELEFWKERAAFMERALELAVAKEKP